MDKDKELRERRNAEMIRRLKAGDTFTAVDAYDTWYPPRPINEKDMDAVCRLYGIDQSKVKLIKSDDIDQS